MLLEDDPGEQDGEDDLEIEQERRRHRRASREAPEEQRRREQAAREDHAGQDPAIARGQGATGRGTSRPEPARQAQKDAGTEVEEAGQEERRHDVEQPLRERGAEPEGERGDQRVEDRHEEALPLYSDAWMANLTERPATPVRAPRGTELSCQGWPQEAALRMLMNNLDPDVAERWEDLVVYGGSGKAARSWEAYHTIVRTLRRLGGDETLLVQSGKPVGVFKTHPDAPQVLIANALLVPEWGDWEHFRRYEAMGLTMYGQMTAGSWIYIGTQGILQGTYETFASCARQHFGGSLAGRLVLSAGLGGMGGAQPLAVTMNGGVGLFVEIDRARIERRHRLQYLDRITDSLEEALRWAEDARARREPLSIGLHGNAAEVHPELARRALRVDVVTDQTSAHDMINGYVPAGLSVEEATALRAREPKEYLKRAYESIAVQMRAMLDFQRGGAVLFDYGNNFRSEERRVGKAWR